MQLIRPKIISLKNHNQLNEKWVQGVIADDPSIIGLGDLILKDIERVQPKAGRLDLLLQHPIDNLRFEVELQLGKMDETHIIRTIEYWDIERKRYPQYDHCAVIIAEDITARFLNVIGLFNGHIPLMALQMKAMELDGNIALVFTKVLDLLTLGEDDSENVSDNTDRKYWEVKRKAKGALPLLDNLLNQIHAFAPDYELNYTLSYVGLKHNGLTNNFVSFRPSKKNVILCLKIRQQDIDNILEESDLDVMEKDRANQYRLRLNNREIEQNKELLTKLMKIAFDESN